MRPSKKVRNAIDKLPKADLRYEITQGKDSRFSRAQSYLKNRLSLLEDEESNAERAEDVSIARHGIRLSTLVIIVSLLSLLAYVVYH